MKTIFHKLTKILLLMLMYCPVALTQTSLGYVPVTSMNYRDTLYEATTNYIGFSVKEDYSFDELLLELGNPPYSSTYSILFMYEEYRSMILEINRDIKEINLLDYLLKFEKKEFVERVNPVGPLRFWGPLYWKEFDIKGQVLRNDKPIINHIVNLFFDSTRSGFKCYTSITDENGNYIFPKLNETYTNYYEEVLYTLSFRTGNSVYDTIVILDDHKVIDFHIAPTWKEFEVKGRVLQNGKPIIDRDITLTDQLDFVCNGITDEDGNYFFPYMREDYEYTLSFQLGNMKYDTTFVLGEDKNIDINFYAPAFDIEGEILHNNKPLSNHTIYLLDQFNLYKDTTDENGNYIFPEMIEKYDYTLFFKIGADRYDTTFVLDGNKVIDFNINVETININSTKDIPTTYSLLQNYPNPFNPTTTIQYSIPKDEHVKLTVYDITGKVVKDLVNGYKTAGKYNVEFNAGSYSSGTYYYKIEAGEYKNIQKMMLIK